MARGPTPVRRAQAVTPFGVGAMLVGVDGVSMITAGLDAWFLPPDGVLDSKAIDISEFQVEEWRLQRYLGVSHFRVAPDYRESRAFGKATPNVGLTLPFLRFPQWHFCSFCDRLTEIGLSVRGRQRCQACYAKGNRRSWLSQVPFVAICDGGHIQDFPWREWVHRDAATICSKQMYLRATGGASLAAQQVRCECGAGPRNLSGITEGSIDSTFLTKNLESGKEFLCPGRTPWHGTPEPRGCARPIKGSLRSASNVYYSVVRSAIYVPRGVGRVDSELLSHFEDPAVATVMSVFKDSGGRPKPEQLRNIRRDLFDPFTDRQIDAAIEIVLTGTGSEEPSPVADDDPETAFRRSEFEVLRREQRELQLVVREPSLSGYGDWLRKFVNRVTLVERLRETRALAGFERIIPESPVDLPSRRALLWKEEPTEHVWLPAYVVFGEGVFLELEGERLRKWENSAVVQRRIATLAANYARTAVGQQREPWLSPRFVLLHTLAHLLINQLTFECGYSSASLRERLYVSDVPDAQMAGILIYTAAGDAEGTMGGLVRMGRDRYLPGVLRRAIDSARWCSADPICMEIGSASGQGPESLNMAACHSCALVPETACEEFNRFLDRGLLVGAGAELSTGFFNE